MNAMRSIPILLALVRREVGNTFASPPVLFASAFFVLLDSFALALGAVRGDAATAAFDNVVLFMLFSSILLFPVVSMYSFSEDNAAGALETLLTAPVSPFTAVLAKYAGAMVFVLVYLAHGAAYGLLLSLGGRLDWNSAASALVALFAFGSFAMSLGVLASALASSPLAAATGAGGVLLFLSLAGGLDPHSGPFSGVFRSMSFLPHAKRWIAGRPDTQGLLYFVSATALFLFYAWLAITSRETERRPHGPAVRRRRTATGFLVAAGFILLIAQAALLHINGFWENDMPLGPNLSRVPRLWLAPLLFAAAAFVWSALTYRAARRAERNDRGARVRRYATITETQVMKAPRYYYEENRRARRRVALAVLAALVVAVNLNVLARYPFREFADADSLGFLSYLQAQSWDVSEDGRNSLSPTTERVLDRLRDRVHVYAFLPEGMEIGGIPVADETRRLLERYSGYNALVTVSFADTLREPELAAQFAGELGIEGEHPDKVLIFEHQGRRLTLPASFLVASSRRREAYDGESRVTGAIMRLGNPGAGGGKNDGIGPRVWIDRRLHFTGPRLRAALWTGLVAMPLVWALAGAAAWRLRRE